MLPTFPTNPKEVLILYFYVGNEGSGTPSHTANDQHMVYNSNFSLPDSNTFTFISLPGNILKEISRVI